MHILGAFLPVILFLSGTTLAFDFFDQFFSGGGGGGQQQQQGPRGNAPSDSNQYRENYQASTYNFPPRFNPVELARAVRIEL